MQNKYMVPFVHSSHVLLARSMKTKYKYIKENKETAAEAEAKTVAAAPLLWIVKWTLYKRTYSMCNVCSHVHANEKAENL